MSAVRTLPLVGLLGMLALVPGVLGGCAFNHGGSTNTQPQQFTTQTTPAAPSVAMVAAFVLIPVVVIGAILAVACRSASATARTGRWVATPTQWMWVEDRK